MPIFCEKTVFLAQKEQYLEDSILEYIDSSVPANTRTAYASGWKHFTLWCQAMQRTSCPATAHTIAMYISYLGKRDFRPSTIRQRLSAIQFVHSISGAPSSVRAPEVQKVMKGIEMQKGVRPESSPALRLENLKKMVLCARESGSYKSIRDIALLLLGYAGAFRRSELVHIRMRDVEETPEGIRILLRSSKGDGQGEGLLKGIPFAQPENEEFCPVSAYFEWKEAASLQEKEHFLFHSITKHATSRDKSLPLQGKMVNSIVQEWAEKAGMLLPGISAHSLRSGFITDAAVAGIPEWIIQKHTGHKSAEVLRGYIREGNVFLQNAVSLLGL